LIRGGAGRRATILVFTVTAACAQGSSRNDVLTSNDPGASSLGSASCTVSAVDEILRWSGRDVYVDPHAVVRTEDGFMIAAGHTYLWNDSAGVPISEPDSVLGFFVGSGGARPIARPRGVDPIGDLRVVQGGAGRWEWLFEQVELEEVGDEPVRVLHATLEDDRWSAPDTVVGRDDFNFSFHASSRLVGGETGLSWLLPGESGVRSEVVEFTRIAGNWRRTPIESGPPEYTLLAADPDLGLGAAIIGPDSAFDQRRSLRVYASSPTPATERTVYVGAGGDVFDWPTLLPGPDGLTLGWVIGSLDGRRTAWAAEGVRPDAPIRTFPLGVEAVQVVSLVLDDGRSVWIVHHSPDDGVGQELRVYTRSPDGEPTLIGAFEHPYTGYFGAVAQDGTDFVVVGPDFSPDPTRPTVRSLVKRMRVSCD
jgi:hypothetical protein